jgi:hypothetical protein
MPSPDSASPRSPRPGSPAPRRAAIAALRLLALPALIAPLACARQQAPALATDIRRAALDATYSLEHLGAGTVQLRDGAFRDSAAGLESRVVVTEAGDLDRDRRPDAAVVLATETGGSGTFVDLFVVLEREGGTVTRGPAPLGDRVQVDSVAVRDGAVELHLVTHGPEDALCCPTHKVVQHYLVQRDALVRKPQELP